MTSGGQSVMTVGALLMQVWSADSWDMHTLDVRCINKDSGLAQNYTA